MCRVVNSGGVNRVSKLVETGVVFEIFEGADALDNLLGGSLCGAVVSATDEMLSVTPTDA